MLAFPSATMPSFSETEAAKVKCSLGSRVPSSFKQLIVRWPPGIVVGSIIRTTLK